MRAPLLPDELGDLTGSGRLARVRLTIGQEVFEARLRTDLAPQTCAHLEARLPLRLKLLHSRWSGEAGWAPLGERDLGLPYESATIHPAPGEGLLYGGGVSEPEILIAYGHSRFYCKAGPLAGNPILAFADPGRLAAVGHALLWRGALDMEIARIVGTTAAEGNGT